MGFKRLTKSVLNVSALPDRVQNQANMLKATFDQAGVDIKEAFNALLTELEASTSAGSIGADVGSVTTKTVQAVLTAFELAIADRYTKAESDALLSSGTNSLVADVDVNLTTGVITVTKKDGTKETFDTALEKVPAKFEIVENGNTFALKITNVDGTTTQADITQFMNVYDFTNSDEVAIEVVGTGNEKTVTASIRANSIGLDKLSLSAVSTLEGYVSSAADSASASATSETNAKASELSAAESKSTAVTKAEEASESASSAQLSAEVASSRASEASESALEAESWAVGGTDSRVGEDTNNAKYWAEQARDASQGGDMWKSVYDADGDGIVDEAEKFGGQLPEYYAKAADLDGKANSSHTHTAVQVASGTFPAGVSCNTPTAGAHLANKAYVDGLVSGGSFTTGMILLWSGSTSTVPTGWHLCDGTNGTPDLRNRFIVGAGSSYSVGATGGSNTVTLTVAEMPSHTHTATTAIDSDGAHTHTYVGYKYYSNHGGTADIESPNGKKTSNTGSSGSHSHTATTTIESAGSGSAHENRPPYYALAYIMKL